MTSITRRKILSTTASAALAYALLLPHAKAAPMLNDSTTFPLWPERPPGGQGPDSSGPFISSHGAYSKISVPTLTVYQPEHPNGTAIIIAAGGGYHYIATGKEAIPAARWLNSLGITAFILTYRLPEEGWNEGGLPPFQDAQRAIRLVKYKAATWHIDPDKVGLMGFSAGGHLMGMCASRPDWQTYQPVDQADSLPLNVQFAMLAYPVVTLKPPYNKTRTHRSLAGRDPTPEKEKAWSIETYITDKAPPFFLIQAADDRIANPANTAILQQACLAHHVPVTRYLFEKGGHGFGMNVPQGGTPWPELAQKWLEENHFLDKK